MQSTLDGSDSHIAAPSVPAPPFLTRLACEALSRVPGLVLPAGQLACSVFGLPGADAAGRWVRLLDALLDADERFARAADGGWTLARTDTEPATGTVVGLAIATTGARPDQHRIVRLAAVRRGHDGALARFDSPLNPRRRLARYLSEAARVSQDEADAAPAFSDVFGELQTVLGTGPIYAYGAGWVRAFVDAELERLDRPGLSNAFVELAGAGATTSGGRKPSLVSLAEQHGISHPRPGYPPADADVAARIALAIGTPGTPGVPSLPGVLPAPSTPASSAGPSTPGTPRASDGPSARCAPAPPALLDRRWLADVPSVPGVYIIEDKAGTVLYVGKAVDLRRRLAAYVGRAFSLHRQLDGLAARAARVRIEPTGSDIEARLLEARLVRCHPPPFNVQRAVRRSTTVIRVGLYDARPGVRLVPEAAPDGAIYFGPYRSARMARAHLTLVREVYPVLAARARGHQTSAPRAKARSVKASSVKSLPAEALLTAASPPEAPPASALVTEQRAACHAIVQLLSGQKNDVLDLLRSRMSALSADAKWAAVDQTRHLIRAALDLEPCPSPLLGLSPAEPLLIVEPVPGTARSRAHLIRDSVLVASTDLAEPYDRQRLAQVADDLAAHDQPPAVPDEAWITLRWLMEPAPGRTIMPLGRLRDC